MIQEEVKKLIEKPILDLGYTSLEVTYKKENGDFYLRVILDKDDPISLDDIVKVNELITPILDEKDLIKERYILDITSLGAEKPIELSRLEKYVSRYINIHLTNPYKGENYLEGTLLEVSESLVTIELTDKARKIKATIDRNSIDKARLAIKF